LLLPTRYFLLTCTLPAGLRALAQAHQKLVYNLLFGVTADAAQALARNPRYIGGQLGMIGILHTWSRTLAFHPHIHYLVPAGGLSPARVWRPARWANYLFPVKALSKLVRGKFRQALRQAGLERQVPAQVWRQAWVVHCKFVGDGQAVLKYLAPYVFHVAISNRRLLALEDHGDLANSRLTFRYRTSGTGEDKTMTLPVEAFLQRFLQHILPKGFVKVRYYGYFAPGCRNRLAAIRQQLAPNGFAANLSPAETPKENLLETLPLCPSCGQPMSLLQVLPRQPDPASAQRTPP